MITQTQQGSNYLSVSSTKEIVIALKNCLAICIVVFITSMLFMGRQSLLSIQPGKFTSLFCLLTWTMIHGTINHLLSNIGLLAICTFLLFILERDRAWTIMIIGAVGTGILVWVFGSNSHHVGASGLILFVATYTFIKGSLDFKFISLIAVLILAILLYNILGDLTFVFQIKSGNRISQEAHIFGVLVGFCLGIKRVIGQVSRRKFILK